MFGVFSIWSIRYADMVSRKDSRRTAMWTSFA